MKRLLWPLLWFSLIALAWLAFVDAMIQTRVRTAVARDRCVQQGGEWFDYGRFEACRVKGDAR